MHKCVKKEVQSGFAWVPKNSPWISSLLLFPLHVSPFFLSVVTKNFIFRISCKARFQIGWVGEGRMSLCVCVCVALVFSLLIYLFLIGCRIFSMDRCLVFVLVHLPLCRLLKASLLFCLLSG